MWIFCEKILYFSSQLSDLDYYDKKVYKVHINIYLNILNVLLLTVLNFRCDLGERDFNENKDWFLYVYR